MCAASARLGHFGKNGIVDRIAATVTKTIRTCVKALECTFDSVEFLAKCRSQLPIIEFATIHDR